MMRLIKLTTLLVALIFSVSANAAVSIEHYDQLDWYDWQEQRGYNPDRDQILDIGDWNQREIEGHWPEIDYTYYEWDEDWYYPEEYKE
jgi:hypothetical protein